MAMLYKHPGPHFLHNEWFDHKVVPAPDIDRALKDGWYLTTTEAFKNSRAKTEPVQEPDPEEVKIVNGYIAPNDLTDDIKNEIACASGTQKELAKKYNVSTYTIHRIKTGKL